MSYNGAFKCSTCPKNNDPEAHYSCPAWWELLEKNDVSSEERISKGCAFTFLPRFLSESMRFSNRAASAAEETREQTLKALSDATRVLAAAISNSSIQPGVNPDPKYLIPESIRLNTSPHDVESSGLVGNQYQLGDELSYPGPSDNRGIGWPSE